MAMNSKPTKKHIENAVGRLSALQFFPSDVEGRAAIMRLIERMVGTVEQLQWLCMTMIDRVGTWRGPVELRGVFCTRFKPADGIEASCVDTPGFTAMDSEAAYIASPEHQKLEGPEAQRLIEGLKDRPN
jgi:hypothetical protein